MPAYIHADVLDEIRFNGRWKDDQVAGGLLVGHHYRAEADGDSFVEIVGFIAGTHCADVAGFTRYLRIQWKAAGSALRFHFPDAEIIGWYLSGRSERAGENRDAVLLHNTFFSQPWQVGIWVPVDDSPAQTLLADGDALRTALTLIVDSAPDDAAKPAKQS